MAWENRPHMAPGWGRLRLAVLRRDSWLCRCDLCKALDRVRVANEVDHILPRAQGGSDDMDNLRAINAKCHERVTLEQQGKRARVKPDPSWGG